MGVLGRLKEFANASIANLRNMGRGALMGRIPELKPLYPGENHWFLSNFTGPGTQIDKRLARGDKPVDELDAISMEHDIAYSRAKTGQDIWNADEVFIRKTNALKNKDRSLYTKASSWITGQLMSAKRKLEQMGVSDVNKWIHK
jgi:hypothetical protein